MFTTPEPLTPSGGQGPTARLGWALMAALALAGLIALDESLAAAWPVPLRALIAGPRLLLGAAFVLVLPGYALTAALFPLHGEQTARLDGLERVGLSLGLSVAWIPALALLLDRLPWGIRLGPVLVGEVLTVLVGLAVAAWRDRGEPAWPSPLGWARRMSTHRRLIGAAGLLLTVALVVLWVVVAPAPDTRLTEFYVLGPAATIEDYPRAAVVGAPLSLTLGLVNREAGARTYWIEVWALDPWTDREVRVQATGPIPLAPGEQVEWPLTWAMPSPGPDQQVEFRLFQQASSGAVRGGMTPYRRLSLWLDVTEAAP